MYKSWCKDYNKNCKKHKRLCKSKKTSQLVWMNQRCRKTCGCQPVIGCGVRGTKAVAKTSVMSLLGLGGDDTRIVGGDDAKLGQYPWQAGVWYTKKSGEQTVKPFCGATLITPTVVLTAAHCFPDNTDPTQHYIKLGDLTVGKKDRGEKSMAIKRIIKHPMYDEETYMHDIAIVVLKKKTKFTKNLKPACIPERNVLPSSCYISGWGATAEEGATAKVLQHVSVPTVANSQCNSVYKTKIDQDGEIITRNMRCAGYEEGKKDACQGDSGGPLSCKRGKKWTLSGVVSWGQGCARARSYGVYTNVHNYVFWIRKTIGWQF